MKPGERIIPFSKKDKRLLQKQLRWQLALHGLYLLSAILLLSAFLATYHHPYFKLLAGGSLVCFAVMLALCLFEKRPTVPFHLIRDLNIGKKRVVHGRVEQARFRQEDARQIEQVYDIGPYRFELGQLSPVLKRFRQVMPGQTVEVHQCLHSGIILQMDIVDE